MFKPFNFSRMFLFQSDPAAGGGGGTPTPEDKAKAEADAKKAEQEKLDKQFAERAARATEAEQKRILESIGVKSLDELTALAKSAKEADDKNKSDLEKAQSALAKAEEDKAKAEADAKAEREASLKRLLDGEIKIGARTPVIEKDKVLRPAFRKEALDEVLLLIDRKAIEEKDGAFTGVEKALGDLAKAKPYLLEEKQEPRRGTPSERNSGGKPNRDGGERTPIIHSL